MSVPWTYEDLYRRKDGKLRTWRGHLLAVKRLKNATSAECEKAFLARQGTLDLRCRPKRRRRPSSSLGGR